MPFEPGDGRITHHATGCDFFDEGYGATANDFDRERMEQDWRERRDEIVALAHVEYPHIKTLWSEREFGPEVLGEDCELEAQLAQNSRNLNFEKGESS